MVLEICTEFAKLHQFASWNCFILHNVDSKMIINRPVSAVKRGEKKVERINSVLKEGFKEGNGNPLQYSCLDNPMGGGAW